MSPTPLPRVSRCVFGLSIRHETFSAKIRLTCGKSDFETHISFSKMKNPPGRHALPRKINFAPENCLIVFLNHYSKISLQRGPLQRSNFSPPFGWPPIETMLRRSPYNEISLQRGDFFRNTRFVLRRFYCN